MDFGDAVKLGFLNYVNFTDRACRSEYWYWYLFAAGGLLVTALIDSLISGRPLTYPIFVLAAFLPGLAVAVRRLHDLDPAAGGYCWP
jgi:uncharacterized membrane protein YhaH (DUF805 family)